MKSKARLEEGRTGGSIAVRPHEGLSCRVYAAYGAGDVPSIFLGADSNQGPRFISMSAEANHDGSFTPVHRRFAHDPRGLDFADKVTGAAEPPANGPRQPQVPVLKVDQYMLENGLKVILHEDHKTPLVGVNIVYKVGSKDDMPGRTGFAHLFEHLMFKGSLHNDQEFSNLLSGFAVETNGTTDRDRTVYFSEITTNAASSEPSGSKPTGWDTCCRRSHRKSSTSSVRS